VAYVTHAADHRHRRPGVDEPRHRVLGGMEHRHQRGDAQHRSDLAHAGEQRAAEPVGQHPAGIAQLVQRPGVEGEEHASQ